MRIDAIVKIMFPILLVQGTKVNYLTGTEYFKTCISMNIITLLW